MRGVVVAMKCTSNSPALTPAQGRTDLEAILCHHLRTRWRRKRDGKRGCIAKVPLYIPQICTSKGTIHCLLLEPGTLRATVLLHVSGDDMGSCQCGGDGLRADCCRNEAAGCVGVGRQFRVPAAEAV